MIIDVHRSSLLHCRGITSVQEIEDQVAILLMRGSMMLFAISPKKGCDSEQFGYNIDNSKFQPTHLFNLDKLRSNYKMDT